MEADSPTSIDARVRTLLRQLRIDRGVKQVELAALLGQPQSFISKYENGDRDLSLAEVRIICLALGSSLPEFVELLEKLIYEGQ